MQLPFDKYEQAKLVETYMVLKDEPPALWSTYIKYLSETLRGYAQSRGITIDKKYRNVAGIRLQISSLDYIFTHGKRGIKSGGRWMHDILALYRNDQTKFTRLLADANRCMGLDNEKFVKEEGSAMDNIVTSTSQDFCAPYENVPDDEVWDKPMLAKAIVAFKEMQKLPANKWDVYVQGITNIFFSYVNYYRPNLANQLYYEAVALKFRKINMLFTERGKVRDDYSTDDLMMYQLYRVQDTRFQEYLNSFSVHIEYAQNNQKESDAVIPTSESESSGSVDLNIYETAKLVELCSRSYTNREMRELSKLMQGYASRLEIEDTDDLRTVYHLNRRMGYIYRLLNGSEEKAGTLPLERKVAQLYLYNREEFDKLLAQANALLINPSIENPTLTVTKVESVNVDGALAVQTGNESIVSNEYTEIQTKCLSLLADFPNGVDVDSPLDIDRFCSKYEELYEGLPLGGESKLIQTLREIGESRGQKVYAPPSQAKKELLSTLCGNVRELFSKGYSCVYFDSLFEKYHSELNEQQIFSTEDLKNILTSALPSDYEVSNNRIIQQGVNANVGKDVLHYLIECGMPMNLSDIYRDVWQIPRAQIRQAINVSHQIINTEKETFMAVDIFPINSTDIDKIRSVLKNTLKNTTNGQLKDEECRQIIENEFPDLAVDTEGYTLKAFHGALGYWLDGDPPFEGKYAMLSRQDIQSTADVFKDFCINRERFTFDDLAEFAKENNVLLSYYYDVIREKSLRLNKDEFCRMELVDFDIEAIDAKLELFCPGEYAPLKTIRNFQLLPTIENIPWDYFLLESYVYSVSKKFYLSHVRFLDTDVAGCMVRRDISFGDYDTLLADALSRYDDWTNDTEALLFLVNEGYLATNRYGKISEVCQKARELKKISQVKAKPYLYSANETKISSRNPLPPKIEEVLNHNDFTPDQKKDARVTKSGGWINDLMTCIKDIPSDEFTMSNVYAYGEWLLQKHSNAKNPKAALRFYMQILRDKGFIDFLGNGHYRKNER